VQKDLFISILSWLKTLPQEGNLRENEAVQILYHETDLVMAPPCEGPRQNPPQA
jgi:hypothetical protein